MLFRLLSCGSQSVRPHTPPTVRAVAAVAAIGWFRRGADTWSWRSLLPTHLCAALRACTGCSVLVADVQPLMLPPCFLSYGALLLCSLWGGTLLLFLISLELDDARGFVRARQHRSVSIGARPVCFPQQPSGCTAVCSSLCLGSVVPYCVRLEASTLRSS